ncbi:MAG TPA: DUF3488 and transglutaminase-like domain-containing protein [Mycobacteriales bacterium]|nr:DUF3488 and transglutaminase-like domain-containing protein [Mycobacteriales bacterium]
MRRAWVAGAATVLAALALGPVYSDHRWIPYVAAAVAAVVAAGVGLRALAAPLWVQPVGTVGALVLYVCVFCGGGLPTPGTLRELGSLAVAGFRDVAELAAPVPSRPGLVLLTVAGVGAVAVVVDVLASGLRTPALAGLPLLGLYAVPVAVDTGSVGWLWFALGAVGYLCLLRTDSAEAVRHWGHSLRTASGTVQRTPAGGSGLAWASVALVAAIAVPAVLPSLSPAGLFATGDGAGLGRGSRDVQTVNPITRLKGELQRRGNAEMLRVRTDDPDPFYLRLTTLDVFRRDQGWSQSPLAAGVSDRVVHGIPRDPGLAPDAPGRPAVTAVEVRGLSESRYLPVYANVRSVDATGDWRYEPGTQTVFSVRRNTRDLAYTLQSFAVDFRPELLAQAPPVPADGPVSRRFAGTAPDPRVQGLVDDIVAGARTPYEKAVALNAYFAPSNGFRYSLATERGTTGDDLLDFLTHKQGYCEQYASALAYLARRAGLPARVAIGFTRGERRDGYWSIGTQDAHAWVEIYFEGLGWVPFDPTPLGGQGNPVPLPYTAPLAASAGDPAASAAPTPTAGTVPGRSSRADALDRQLSREGGAAGSPLAPPPAASRWPWVLAVVVALALLAVPGVARTVVRRRRYAVLTGGSGAGAAHAAWDEVADTLTDLGVPVSAASTPRGTALEIGAGFDEEGRAAMRVLATAEEHARYAPGVGGPPADGLADAVGAVRVRLAGTAGWPARARAAVLPASTVETGLRRLAELRDRTRQVRPGPAA